MDIRRFGIAALVAAIAVTSSAKSVFYDSDYWQKRSKPWIGATFTNAVVGSDLSNDDVFGGSWGLIPIPEGATAKIREESGVKYVAFDTQEASSNLVFSADLRKSQPVEIKFSIRFTEDGESLLDISDVAKAAFTVSREGEGMIAGFYGYTKNGWVRLRLPSDSLYADFNCWYDVAIRMIDGCTRVSYALKTADGYETLVDDYGASILDAGTGGVTASGGEFELRGKADFGVLDSSAKNTGITLRVNDK